MLLVMQSQRQIRISDYDVSTNYSGIGKRQEMLILKLVNGNRNKHRRVMVNYDVRIMFELLHANVISTGSHLILLRFEESHLIF